jgi:hypothetical protein
MCQQVAALSFNTDIPLPICSTASSIARHPVISNAAHAQHRRWRSIPEEWKLIDRNVAAPVALGFSGFTGSAFPQRCHRPSVAQGVSAVNATDKLSVASPFPMTL